MLYNVVALQTGFYSSQNDLGPNVITQLSQAGLRQNSAGSLARFRDLAERNAGLAERYGLIADSLFCAGIAGRPLREHQPVRLYRTSASPASARRERSRPCRPTNRDSYWNNASIFKIQYQHNIGSNAYVRLYGYSFYSDWLQTSALSYGTPFFGFGALSYDYELESHTRGLSFTFADQLNSQHCVTLDANYVTASTNRFNNTNFNNTPVDLRDKSHER